MRPLLHSVVLLLFGIVPLGCSSGSAGRGNGDEGTSTAEVRVGAALKSKARAADRRGAEAALQEARGFLDDRKFDAAIRELDRAIDLDPAYLEAYALRAGAHWEKKAYDQALRD